MIPLLDLDAQYRSIQSEITNAIHRVLEHQHFIMGSEVSDFEEQIAAYIGTDHALGCASGSDALLLALMAMDLQPGDLVLTSPFTFFATAGAISRLGGIPVFLDIEPDSFNLDPAQVRAFLEGDHPLYKRLDPDAESIKAIIPVHLYGQMADMDPIMELASEFDLKVIEDAAQAIGSQYKGRQAGTIGDFGCFSFFPSKNLGAYGDGGLITVKDPELAEKAAVLRLHGAKPKYHHSLVGINSRLDALQAAILGVKLRYLDEWSQGRQQIAAWYNHYFHEAGLVLDAPDCMSDCSCAGLDGCGLGEGGVILPKETTGDPDHGGRHIYHQYTIRIKDRDGLARYLNDHGIGNAVYYPVPLHVQGCFADLEYRPEDCPAAMCASRQAISLPVYPELKEEQVKEVVMSVKAHAGV